MQDRAIGCKAEKMRSRKIRSIVIYKSCWQGERGRERKTEEGRGRQMKGENNRGRLRKRDEERGRERKREEERGR